MNKKAICVGDFNCNPICNIKQINSINNINNEKIKNCPKYICNWMVSNDGRKLKWNNQSEFIDYEDWLIFIINNYLKPNNIKLNGVISWFGVKNEDMGKIKIINNEIRIYKAVMSFIKRDNEYNYDDLSDEENLDNSLDVSLDNSFNYSE